MNKSNKKYFKFCIAAISFTIFFGNLFAQDNSLDGPPVLKIDESESMRYMTKAVLQILDKTTAKTEIVEVKIKDFVNFGHIKIKAIKCWQAPLDQKPDSRILVEVYERNSSFTFGAKSDVSFQDRNKEEKIFSGWLIASSPSISSLEHPVYDIVAISCKK